MTWKASALKAPRAGGPLEADGLATGLTAGVDGETACAGGEVVLLDDAATGGNEGVTRLAAGVVAGLAGVVRRLAFWPGGGTPVAPS